MYDGIVISDKHVAMPVIDDEETLISEEKSRSKMSEKAKDPEIIDKNISHKPIDYENLNRLFEDFGKRFTPQQEMDVEQVFWLRISNPTSKPFDASLVKIEAPKELLKVSLVNESLKRLKFHLSRFDNVVKIRTTPDARTEGNVEQAKAEPTPIDNELDRLPISMTYEFMSTLVYVRDTCPNAIILVLKGSSKKAKIVESKNANHSEPNHTWGSNATDIPSSSSLVWGSGCPDCSLVSGLRMFKTHDREPSSAHMNCVRNFRVYVKI
ncbi:hypothetical protein Tco_0927390 [Tanacetum coccineum]